MRKVLDRMSGNSEFVCEPTVAAAEVLWTNGAFESSPIVPIPESERFEIQDKHVGNKQAVISGIDGIITSAYQKEKLFSELSVPWATPGELVGVETYREFKGGKTGKKLP